MPATNCARRCLQFSAAVLQIAALLLIALLCAITITIRTSAAPTHLAATQALAAPDGFGWDRSGRPSK